MKWSILICSLVFGSSALAQDGAHNHSVYEQELKERKDVDAVIGQEIIDLKSAVNSNRASIVELEGQVSSIMLRLEALESVEPTPEPEPIPEPIPEPVIKGGLQGGIWYPASFNLEEPYADLFSSTSILWYGDNWRQLDTSQIDPMTGLPKNLGSNSSLTSNMFFTNPPPQMREWDGQWILKADCIGDVEIGIVFAPKELIDRKGPCEVHFTRDNVGGKTLYHHAVNINRLNGSISNVRLCRVEDIDRCDAGVITSSRFASLVEGYTDLRYMNLQSATTALIRSVEDQATMKAEHWGTASNAVGGHPPYVGMPLEVPFVMSVETNTIAWVHWPITLGAPEVSGDAGVWRQAAKENAETILNSVEWDRYGDAFVAALIKSGYPETRKLKVSLSNEVWNFSSEYHLTTNYAWGIGEGLRSSGLQGHEIRTGYGALFGRMREALNKALVKAGRQQNIEYIVESQAAWDLMSIDALRGLQWYVKRSGEEWADAKGEIGLSVASYWAGDWAAFDSPSGWAVRIASDPQGTMDAFKEFILTDSANYGAQWVYTVIAAHKKVADTFGIPLTGFYEGGSHLDRPDYISKDWYTKFLWGEHGAAINAEVNSELRKRYPDTTLSNYVIAGEPGKGPWEDGTYSSPTPMMKSWDLFKHKN